MPKVLRLLVALLFVGCASQEKAPTEPEADLYAPGMIPAECEAILQKSQEWGYYPGEKWRPKSEAQAIEAARFLSTFTVIPAQTSRYLDSWKAAPRPETDDEARAQLENLSRAQSCDAFLPQAFFEGLFAFRWSREARPELARSLQKFIANQQSRTSFLLPRAVSLFLFDEGVRRGLLRMQRGSRKDLGNLQRLLEKEREEAQAELNAGMTGEAPPSPLQIENAMRKEMELSERLRDRMSRYLPLP